MALAEAGRWLDTMMRDVRTTITLDPDLAARLRRLAAERGTSFKSTVNTTLRAVSRQTIDTGDRIVRSPEAWARNRGST